MNAKVYRFEDATRTLGQREAKEVQAPRKPKSRILFKGFSLLGRGIKYSVVFILRFLLAFLLPILDKIGTILIAASAAMLFVFHHMGTTGQPVVICWILLAVGFALKIARSTIRI